MGLGEESRYATQMNRYFLIPLGAWPLPLNASFVFRLLQRAAVIVIYCLIAFLLIPCALHTFLEETDLAVKLKLLGPMNFTLTAIGKYCSLLSRINEIGECFEHVEADWKFYKKRHATVELSVMRNKAKIGNILSLLCATFMYGGGFCYHAIMPMTSGRITTSSFIDKIKGLEIDNSTDLNIYLRAPRVLPHPVYEHLMKVEESPWYEIVFLMQTTSAGIVYTITIAACSLAAVFVLHVCSQLEIVMRLLEDFVHGKDAGCSHKMRVIVETHIRALRLAMNVEKNLNFICFIEFTGCTLNICFLGYYFITEWESQNTISTVTYSILLISFVFNIFIFCYIGDILTEQCGKVGEITYAVEWYKLPGKKAADIIVIIIIASCYPARITAGKMVYLSMSSFCNVMKTATAYLNLLRTVMI